MDVYSWIEFSSLVAVGVAVAKPWKPIKRPGCRGRFGVGFVVGWIFSGWLG